MERPIVKTGCCLLFLSEANPSPKPPGPAKRSIIGIGIRGLLNMFFCEPNSRRFFGLSPAGLRVRISSRHALHIGAHHICYAVDVGVVAQGVHREFVL